VVGDATGAEGCMSEKEGTHLGRLTRLPPWAMNPLLFPGNSRDTGSEDSGSEDPEVLRMPCCGVVLY
jgi:hypothetical protein